jgi:hypothetical protein
VWDPEDRSQKNAFCGGAHAYLVPFEKAAKMEALFSGEAGFTGNPDCIMNRPDYNNYCLQWDLVHELPNLPHDYPKDEEQVQDNLLRKLQSQMDTMGFTDISDAGSCTPRSGKAILSVFARREASTRFIMPLYIFHLLNGTFDEIHVWNFGSNSSDRVYIDSLRGLADETGIQVSKFQIMNPAATGRDGLTSAYLHYADTLTDLDIFVKVDDDIVTFLGMSRFVEYLRCTNWNDLVFPNIINNDLAVPFQINGGMLGNAAKACMFEYLERNGSGTMQFALQTGLIDLLDGSEGMANMHLRARESCSKELHEDFLQNMDKYQSWSKAYEWSNAHVSSNPAFGSNGEFARRVFTAIHGNLRGSTGSSDRGEAGAADSASIPEVNMKLFSQAVSSHLPYQVFGELAEVRASGDSASQDDAMRERYRSALTFVLPNIKRWKVDFQRWLGESPALRSGSYSVNFVGDCTSGVEACYAGGCLLSSRAGCASE